MGLGVDTVAELGVDTGAGLGVDIGAGLEVGTGVGSGVPDVGSSGRAGSFPVFVRGTAQPHKSRHVRRQHSRTEDIFLYFFFIIGLFPLFLLIKAIIIISLSDGICTVKFGEFRIENSTRGCYNLYIGKIKESVHGRKDFKLPEKSG